MISNKDLYESHSVIDKYASNNVRHRCLNNPEKYFIDDYDIKDKKVLVLGSGIGRVPSNLLLFGNSVVGLELSDKLYELSNLLFPNEKFKELKFVHGNAVHLEMFKDNSFDVVWFPQNGIDYTLDLQDRYRIIREMTRVCKVGGIVSFSSLNSTAFCLSYKIPWRHIEFKNIFKNFLFRETYVVGGGVRYMSKPQFLIKETLNIASLKYLGFTADIRHGIDYRITKYFKLSSYIFPWLNYVFRKI